MKRRQAGFSLIELLVTMAVFTIIMISVYMLILHYGDATKTEQARIKVQQENRFISSVFSEELKDAGSVLTLSHTGGFLAATPYFNGVFPLNNSTFPDGIILASGDPEAVTRLAADHANGSVLNVDSALVQASLLDPVEYPPWTLGDIGAIVSQNGYYIFSVVSANTGANTITIRPWEDAVYYSGQLVTTNYYDMAAGGTGKDITYPAGSMVVRLANFAIYLFRETVESRTNRNLRQLIRVNDTHGAIDVLSDANANISIISENIWDMQISYVVYQDFASATRSSDPDSRYYASQSSPNDLNALLTDIRGLKLKQIDVTVVTLTDTYGGKGKLEDSLPIIGDRSVADTLPTGKYGLKITTYSVEPRNFNIVLVPKT
jgi:prepilin-type N-terminal cleavage/methylation domain-containing protein